MTRNSTARPAETSGGLDSVNDDSALFRGTLFALLFAAPAWILGAMSVWWAVS